MAANLDPDTTRQHPESPNNSSSSSDSSPPHAFSSYEENGESKSSENFDYCYAPPPPALSRSDSSSSINSFNSLTSNFINDQVSLIDNSNQLHRLKEENDRLKATLNALYFEMHSHGDLQVSLNFNSDI